MSGKKYLLTLILITALLLPAAVLASDISSALWYGTIRVSNNGTAAEKIVTVMTLDSQELIDDFGVDTDFDYVAIRSSSGADIPFMPSVNNTYPWCLWVESIGADTHIDYTLYTGNGSMSSTKYIFATLTTSDDVSLESGDNFTDECSCYVNTNHNGTISKKGELYRIYGVGDNISVSFPGLATSVIEDGTGSAWTNMSDSIDSDATNYATSDITQATWSKYLVYTGNATYTDRIAYYATRESIKVENIDADFYYDSAWHNVYQGTATFNSWATVTHTSNETITGFRVRFQHTADSTSREVYLHEVSPLGCLTAETSSSKRKIEVSANTTHLALEIDDVVEDTLGLGGVSLTDTSEDWQNGEPSTTPYIEYVKRYVDGTLVQHIEWEYDTTFTDLSGNGNDANPSFRTESSSENVSAELISFLPISQAVSTTIPSTSWPSMITEAPDEPSTAYSEESRPGIFFEPIIYALCTVAGIPESFFWYNFCFFIIILAGMVTYRIHPSLVIKGIVMMALMIFFALPGLNIYGMFTVIYFVMASFGLIVLSRSYGI